MIKYYLNRPNKAGQSLVLLYITPPRQNRIQISTGLKVKQQHWSSKKQRVKTNSADAFNINRILDKIENDYKEAVLELRARGEQITKENLNQLVAMQESGGKIEFFEFWQNHIEKEIQKRGQIRVKQQQTALNKFRKFAPRATFAGITKTLIESYTAYLESKGYTKNYIGNLLKNIKIILKAAYDAGLHKNEVFSKIKKQAEKVDTIYLSETELQILHNNKALPAYLERARDLFLIGCYTGLRYSDFSEIRPENIRDNMLHIRTRKTGTPVVIPMRHQIHEIIKRNGNQLPPKLSNAKLNVYIKDICRVSGINQKITTTRTEGGRRVERTAEKWQLVTTHTARRSFATNAYLAGIPTPSIMLITGHSTHTQFMRYIRINQEQNANILKNHDFFK